MSRKLYIIRGHSGSGKSTLAKHIANSYHTKDNNVDVVEADDYFMQNCEYKFDQSQLGEAHYYCKNEVLYMMKLDTPIIIVANTFTRLWEMKAYLDMADEFLYDVTVIRCENDFQNVHNVPEEIVARQKNRMEDYHSEVIYIDKPYPFCFNEVK